MGQLILLAEYLITQYIRKKRPQVPFWIYQVGDILSEIVSFLDGITQRLDKLYKYVLDKNKQWLPSNTWYVIAGIILPCLWFASPSVGESTAAKLIDNGKTWWYSFEGWVLTSEWKPSYLSFPPEQFVWDYCAAINKGNFSQAWDMTTPDFKNNKKLMPQGYNSYLEWWKDEVQEVKLNKVTLISKNNNSAVVDVDWQFFMKKKPNNSQSTLFVLSWNTKNSKWVLYTTKKL
ncbi:hypothetical protein [Limnofasciculus baicalensis]|uniref:hypothetical protein n=1 Tax=Limnofasciculus baicalensis TaxID=3064906 RepID=UPI0020A7B94D|nr:hypothetical protein [Limnofasciculus baicalensis]